MAEEPRMGGEMKKKKNPLQIADICLESVKNMPPPLSSSTPSSPRHAREHASHGKLSCLCSPTTHPGSFRCRHHRNHMRTSMSVGSKLNEMATSK